MRLRSLVDALPARLAVPVRARFGDRDPEVDELRRFIKPGDTVWDVGAHKGAYTWHLARAVGPAGEVHAFEPQPDLAARLRKAFHRPVQVHELALSDTTATARLTVPVWGTTRMQGHASLEHGSAGEALTVTTLVGDELHQSPTFVKADVEGHELAFLRGASETLARAKPVLLLEIDYRHASETATRGSLVSWLDDHHYRAHYLDGGVIKPAPRLTADVDPNPGLDTTRYIYNWFLIPE
jgi:FkbM family methyltransferase